MTRGLSGQLRSAEARRPGRFARRAELLKRHQQRWLDPFPPVARAAKFERGFVTELEVAADAFLLAFDQDAPYDNPNFRWFGARYSRFVYVDRIVVASSARGRGLARMLYRDLFAEASRAGHSRIVCEVNCRPPNPGSDAFHAALGFAEVGVADIHDGRKTVRYLSLTL